LFNPSPQRREGAKKGTQRNSKARKYGSLFVVQLRFHVARPKDSRF